MGRFLKRATVFLLTVALVAACLPMAAFAADDTLGGQALGTSFSFTFGSSLPTPYQGVSGQVSYKLSVGAALAYSLDIGTFTPGGALQSATTSGTVSDVTTDLVNIAISYGYHGTPIGGATDSVSYYATQVLIWNIVSGAFYDTALEQSVNNVFFNGVANGAATYNAIKADIVALLPSFVRMDLSNPAVYEATYNAASGKFEFTLTDSNAAVGSCSYGSGVWSIARTGNVLNFTSAVVGEEVIRFERPVEYAGSICFWTDSSNSFVTVVPGTESANAVGAIKLVAKGGSMKIEAVAEDGEKFENFSFEITGNGIQPTTITTDANGEATKTKLPPTTGTNVYTITPVSAVGPKYAAQLSKQFTVAADQQTGVTFEYKIVRGKISIQKYKIDPDTGVRTAFPGVAFDIYEKAANGENGTFVQTITTDGSGYILSSDLLYGEYLVNEQTPTGYKQLAAFEVDVDTEGRVYSYSIDNEVYEGMLTIQKVDADTGNTIPYAGAQFMIKDAGGDFVKQNNSTVFVTAADGTLSLPQPLRYGSYELIEILAPYGYKLESTPLPFNISLANENSNEIIVVDFPDEIMKGTITIEATGMQLTGSTPVTGSTIGEVSPAYANLPVSGVQYAIIADDDIVTPDGTVQYRKDERIETVTTDAAGMAYSSLLVLGKYRIEEVSTATGFVESAAISYVHLVYQDQTTVPEETVLRSCPRQKAAVTFFADMELGIGQTVKAFNDLVYGIYAKYDITINSAATAQTLTMQTASLAGPLAINSVVAIPAGALVGIATVDAHGNGSISADLPYGDYYLAQLTTATGYVPDMTQYAFTFAPASTTTATVPVAVSGGNPIMSAVIKGQASVKIVDQHDSPVSGAKFKVYTADDMLVTELTSQQNGVTATASLTYGSYYCIQSAATSGCAIDTARHVFAITNNGASVIINVINIYTPVAQSAGSKPATPTTGDGNSIMLWSVSGVSAMAVAGLAIMRKKRRIAETHEHS